MMSEPLTLQLVTLAMRQSRGVKSEAAAALGVTFGQLHRWLNTHAEDVAELLDECDALMVDAAREVLRDSIDGGGLKASFFTLERKAGDWARRSKSEVSHRLAEQRPKPAEFLPPVVDERQLAVEQSKQLPAPKPAEIPDAEVEPIEEVVPAVADDEASGRQAGEQDEVVADEPLGGPYGPCPHCAANLKPPGAWAKAEGHKGSCSSCGYPATQAPQTIAQALTRH